MQTGIHYKKPNISTKSFDSNLDLLSEGITKLHPSASHLHESIDCYIIFLYAYNDILFISNSNDEIYKFENGTTEIFYCSNKGILRYMLVSDGALWCFKEPRDGGINVHRHNLQTQETTTSSPICHWYSGAVTAVCAWNSMIAVAFHPWIVKTINQFGFQMMITTKEPGDGDPIPSALGAWGDSLCVGFKDGGVNIYTKEGKVKLKIPPQFIFNPVKAITPLKLSIYVQRKIDITSYDSFGNAFKIYQGAYTSDMVKSVLISRGRILRTDGGNSMIQLHVSYNTHMDDIIFGDRVVSWMGRLWTISRNRNKIITWDLCEKWSPEHHASYPKDVREVIKAIVCMSHWNKFPGGYIPNDLVYIIIGLAVYQWVPNFATKWIGSKPSAAKHRILN